MKRRKGLLDEEKFLPPLPEQLPRGVSSLPGYGQTSPVAQGLLGFTGRNPTYSVMSPEAQQMSDAYRLGEQASVASQLYGSVLPFAVASTMASAQRAGSLLSPLTVFHGSPHKFSKFDASKIGTGEGAQAYGHGLYFAESKDVAKSYENALSQKKNIAVFRGDDGYYVREGLGDTGKNLAGPFRTGSEAEQARKALPQNQGSLYTVDLPDEQIAKMLDWDKPIKDQPEVLNIIRSQINDADIARSFDVNVEKGISGANAMKNYVQGKTQADQSAVLQKLGVPGIRYLDEGSRSAKKGTSNFVVFPGEESKLRIMEVNGKPVVIDEEELRRSGLLGVAQ